MTSTHTLLLIWFLAARPPTLEQAAAQLGSWLDGASVPPLIGATGRIVIHDRMSNPWKGGKPRLRKFTVEDGHDLRTRVLEIVASHQKEPLTVPSRVTCDGTCCTFDDDLWGGATFVHLAKVCMAKGPDGRPTRYTDVHLSRMAAGARAR